MFGSSLNGGSSGSPRSRDGAARRQVIRRLELHKPAPDPALDQVTALACRHFQVPIAKIALVDADSIHILSVHGADASAPRRVPLDYGFSTHVMIHNDVLVIPDARADERFKSHPFVRGRPHTRFFAGAPLAYQEAVDGGPLGSVSS